MSTISKRWPLISMALLLSLAVSTTARGGDSADNVEARTARSSNGAGLRVGIWDVAGNPSGNGASHTPSVEGYFQKGLDTHLVWENTLGYWGDTYTETQSGLLGSSQTKFTTHLVSSLTALKLYPFTTRADPFEPFAVGGLGLALGIDEEQPSGSGATSAGSTTNVVSGLGIRAGGGFDWHWTPEFGMTAGARYQWATFGQEVGSRAMFRGPAVDAGLTYRFQYQ